MDLSTMITQTLLTLISVLAGYTIAVKQQEIESKKKVYSTFINLVFRGEMAIESRDMVFALYNIDLFGNNKIRKVIEEMLTKYSKDHDFDSFEKRFKQELMPAIKEDLEASINPFARFRKALYSMQKSNGTP